MSISVISIMFITTIICGIIALLVYHFKRLPLYLRDAEFPGPIAIPILGNAHYFLGETTDLLNKIGKLFDSYPSPFRVWLGNRLHFYVCEPEQLKTIFLSPKCIDKEDVYKFARPWLGEGLVTASGSKWRIHRKLIGPTFNTKILERFVKVFNKQSIIMTIKMEKELQGNEFDIFQYVSLCTLDIICETAMGVELGAQSGEDGRYIDSANRLLEILFTRVSNIWMHPDFIFNLTQSGRDQRECLKYLHGLTDDVIKKRRNSSTVQTTTWRKMIQVSLINDARLYLEVIENNERTSTRKAFLDLLMELLNDGAKFTDEELREEVDTMMISGNETTASVNSFVMLMLANNPDIQERVYRELCEIYGDEVSSDSPVKHEDLNRMEYLERVIKETLRLFPVSPIMGRQITDDLNIGDHIFPRGSSVVLGIIKVHRWEKYWPNPLKFDPDRFLPEEVAKRHPYCYVPFSAGPRNCIGLKYAMMAMKVLLATVLRRYVLKKDKILAIKDIKLRVDAVLRPTELITIKIEKR